MMHFSSCHAPLGCVLILVFSADEFPAAEDPAEDPFAKKEVLFMHAQKGPLSMKTIPAAEDPGEDPGLQSGLQLREIHLQRKTKIKTQPRRAKTKASSLSLAPHLRCRFAELSSGVSGRRW